MEQLHQQRKVLVTPLRHIQTCVHVLVSAYICVCACLRVYDCVCMCVCIHTHVHASGIFRYYVIYKPSICLFIGTIIFDYP